MVKSNSKVPVSCRIGAVFILFGLLTLLWRPVEAGLKALPEVLYWFSTPFWHFAWYVGYDCSYPKANPHYAIEVLPQLLGYFICFAVYAFFVVSVISLVAVALGVDLPSQKQKDKVST